MIYIPFIVPVIASWLSGKQQTDTVPFPGSESMEMDTESPRFSRSRSSMLRMPKEMPGREMDSPERQFSCSFVMPAPLSETIRRIISDSRTHEIRIFPGILPEEKSGQEAKAWMMEFSKSGWRVSFGMRQSNTSSSARISQENIAG